MNILPPEIWACVFENLPMWDTVSFARAHKTCEQIFNDVQGLSIEQYDELHLTKQLWNRGPDHFTEKWKQLAIGDIVVRHYVTWYCTFYMWWRVDAVERCLTFNNYLCSRFVLRRIPHCLFDNGEILEVSAHSAPSMFLGFNGNIISRDDIWVVPFGSEKSLVKIKNE